MRICAACLSPPPKAHAVDNPHLLIVDDDERLRALLGTFLSRNGFLVTKARDAAHARRVLSGLQFDLIVMDVMMPGEDGIALCADLRQRMDVPILLLTARGDTSDRIAGLEAGADDYLVKPFDPKELLLRVNAILRRRPSAPAPADVPALQMGARRYDTGRGELWHGEELVRLTTTESQLMRLFAAHVGTPLSRARLLEEMSGDGAQQERAVDVQVTRLRRKIEDDPKQPRYLQTVRGEGYALTVD